jgi:hypothetical protein
MPGEDLGNKHGKTPIQQQHGSEFGREHSSEFGCATQKAGNGFAKDHAKAKETTYNKRELEATT